MTKIIAVDLDETLSETIESVLSFHNYKIKNIPIIKSEISNYIISDIEKFKQQNINHEDTARRFHDCIVGSNVNEIKPLEYAKQKLLSRKNSGYKIYIITARVEERKEPTQNRINTHFPDIFDDIIFANHFSEKSRSKGEICQEIGANIMIEDNLQYAQDLSNYGITTYLLAKPRNTEYNNTNPLIIKVDSRQEITL